MGILNEQRKQSQAQILSNFKVKQRLRRQRSGDSRYQSVRTSTTFFCRRKLPFHTCFCCPDSFSLVISAIFTFLCTIRFRFVSSMSSTKSSPSGSDFCRICHDLTRQSPLIAPCHCSGSIRSVHLQCLEYWLSQSRSEQCELCRFHYECRLQYPSIFQVIILFNLILFSNHFGEQNKYLRRSQSVFFLIFFSFQCHAHSMSSNFITL